MTWLEHYREAERWLRAAETVPGGEWVLVDTKLYAHEQCARLAQVHATLATIKATDHPGELG